MIAPISPAKPLSRAYREQEWNNYQLKKETVRAIEESRKKADIDKRFERLKKLHTKKWQFGQGDLQEGEEE